MFSLNYIPRRPKRNSKIHIKSPADITSTGVIFILGKGVSDILASGVNSTWSKGSSEPGFSIMSELTVLKDGKIVNTTLVIPAKFSAEFSDQKLLDIKGIITHTQLDEIPHNTSAVRFNWGIPRELIVQLLESKNYTTDSRSQRNPWSLSS